MLRVDPTQRTRLIEIIRSLTDRIVEAKLNGWLGEVEGLNVSLEAARTKLVSLERTSRSGGGITPPGVSPVPNQSRTPASAFAPSPPRRGGGRAPGPGRGVWGGGV